MSRHSYTSTKSYYIQRQRMLSCAKSLLPLNWLNCIPQWWVLTFSCMQMYASDTLSAGKGSSKLKSGFPLHTHAERCRTMTKCLSWYMKGIFVERVMSFFRAAEVVKAIRWAEFRSAPESTRSIRRGFVDQNARGAALAFRASLARRWEI